MIRNTSDCIKSQDKVANDASAIVGRPLHVLAETNSTNRALMDMAKSGAPHGTVVVSDHQTAGSGKGDRIWFSKPGAGLCVSVLVKLPIPLDQLSQITLLTAVAMLDALTAIGVTTAQVKWPNDILINGRKICGILAEAWSPSDDDSAFAVVGVGLNINMTTDDFPEELREIATSLAMEMGNTPSRQHILDTFLSSFDTWLTRWCEQGFAAISEAWCAQSSTLGRRVEFDATEITVVGKAISLNSDGSLLIREDSGALHCFYSGEMRYLDVPLFEPSYMRSVS